MWVQQKIIDEQAKKIRALEEKLEAQEKRNAGQDARLKKIEEALAKH